MSEALWIWTIWSWLIHTWLLAEQIVSKWTAGTIVCKLPYRDCQAIFESWLRMTTSGWLISTSLSSWTRLSDLDWNRIKLCAVLNTLSIPRSKTVLPWHTSTIVVFNEDARCISRYSKVTFRITVFNPAVYSPWTIYKDEKRTIVINGPWLKGLIWGLILYWVW